MSHEHGGADCRKMVEILSDYIDGELDAGMRRLLEEHNGDCPPCRTFVATLARTVEAVRAQPRESIPPELIANLTEALRKSRR